MVSGLGVLFWYRVAMVSEEVIFELRPYDKRNQSCEDLGDECSKHKRTESLKALKWKGAHSGTESRPVWLEPMWSPKCGASAGDTKDQKTKLQVLEETIRISFSFLLYTL